MSTMPDFSEISENFAFLDDWEDRYRYLIELGQGLEGLSEAEKTADSKVSGCVSQVWLVVDEDNGLLSFRGDSDAMLVKGIVAVLIALYSGKPASEIAKTDAVAMLDELGLREHLTAQRSNGLIAMVKRMRSEAATRA